MLIYPGFFLDIFPHAKPTRVGKTLSFFKNSLSLSWNSLSFLKICLSLVKKMSFGAIFLENFHTKLNKLRKIWLLVGKFLSFLTNLLEFSGKIAWVFSGSALNFFRNVQKKSLRIVWLRSWPDTCYSWELPQFASSGLGSVGRLRRPWRLMSGPDGVHAWPWSVSTPAAQKRPRCSGAEALGCIDPQVPSPIE